MKFTRKLALAATFAILSLGANAQEAAAPTPELGDIFQRMQQLQDANLGIARQIAETEQKAASELLTALADGRIDAVHEKAARAFVANALTLASVMLSPIQTRAGAGSDVVALLIQRNIALLQSVAPYAAQDRNFAAAIARYTVLQLQTQDLVTSLQNGWRRYGDIMAEAERNGLLADTSFDPGSQTWGLVTPTIGGSDVAAALPPAAALPAPAEQPAAAPAEPAAAPVAETAAVAATAASPTPVPALTGTPGAAPADDLAASVKPLEPAMPASTETASDTTERLPSTGALEVAAPPPRSGPIGDWVVATDANGTRVSARNLNGDTTAAISALTIRCAADGSIEYVVDAAQEFGSFRVYADRSAYRTVRAFGNVVSSDNTAAMSNTLQLAHDWAQQVPDAGRRLTLRAEDAAGTTALFSANGYVQARDTLAEYCAGPKQPVAMNEPAPPVEAPAAPAQDEPATETAVPPTAPPAPAPAPAASAPEATAAEPAPATPAPEPQPAVTTTTATPTRPPRDPNPPIPRPRLERPVDIMSNG